MLPEKDFNLIVGLRIREVRENLQMTRAVFSETCNISESFLAAVENGQKSVSAKTLFKICSSFNISADYFIRGNKEGFETSSITELINSLDKSSKEYAIRILRDYVRAIHTCQEKNKKSSETQNMQ